MGGERRDARALRLQVLYAGLGVRDTKRLGYEKDLNRYKCRKLASDLKKKKRYVPLQNVPFLFECQNVPIANVHSVTWKCI